MRCSICDAKNPRWIYHNWHCHVCEEIIHKTIGVLPEDINEEEEHLLELEWDDED